MTTTPHRGDAAPGYLLYLTDPARAAFDYTLLAYATPLLAALPRGDNHPVLVLPRLHGSDASTSTLRTVLKQLGYRTYGWQLGRNIGPTSKVVHGMRARLDYLTNRYQRPVTLIGWSLGGIYARQLARRTPQAVRQVITLGSPIRLVRHEQSRANRAVSSLRPRTHRALGSAARTRRRAASGPGNVDLHPARRDRRLADLPGRALASHGEHRRSRQPPRHRQSPSGALGDRGPSRPARRPMETVSTAVATADGLPRTRELIMTNLANILTESARRHPDRPAIRLDDILITYAELDELTARAAGWLRARGIEPGDRVAIALPNVVAFPVFYYGVLRAGATVVPMNPLLKSREIEHHLSDSGAKLALVWSTVAAEAKSAAKATGTDVVVIDDDTLAAAADWPSSPAVAARDDADTAVILYTSGTTGTPERRTAHPRQSVPQRHRLHRSCSTYARTTSCWAVCRCFTHSGRATD